jgi:pilus assembly protein Flp/PilA
VHGRENRAVDYELVVSTMAAPGRRPPALGARGTRQIARFLRKLPHFSRGPTSAPLVVAWPLPLGGHEARFAAAPGREAADGNSNSRREPCRIDRIACRGDAQEDAMTTLVNFYNSIRRNDEGQDLLEYALLVALIAIVAVGAVTAAGTQVSNIFNQIATAI